MRPVKAWAAAGAALTITKFAGAGSRGLTRSAALHEYLIAVLATHARTDQVLIHSFLRIRLTSQTAKTIVLAIAAIA